MQFEFYLNSQNKQHMELLVRKLNQITGQANTKLNAQTYQQSFDEQFKRLCTALARIYQTRLGAIQELEQAAQTQTQQEKLQRVQTATNKLKQSKKSLLPLEPLIENYTKCDSLQLLVNLILLQYDQQYEQCGYILNAKHKYSKAFEQMLDQARSVYSRADVQSTFVMTLNAITPPYKLENQFDQVIAGIKQIYSLYLLIFIYFKYSQGSGEIVILLFVQYYNTSISTKQIKVQCACSVCFNAENVRSPQYTLEMKRWVAQLQKIKSLTYYYNAINNYCYIVIVYVSYMNHSTSHLEITGQKIWAVYLFNRIDEVVTN
ncbi:Conserved_hypothetical protein [Hexamita inflata]|uniref:Uncharacterized protein n=1 Tax=Hexamita inflata TaxID=28002 RepID=A0AA86QDN8_9EUKA|nr:Conserved hypothetical protein [Hexamita inflata]